MGDITKFSGTFEYHVFNVLLILLLVSEIFIFCYTHSKQKKTVKIDTSDLGTKWLLYLNFVFCLIVSFWCVSQKAPFYIRKLMLPAYFEKIGMLIIVLTLFITFYLKNKVKKHPSEL